MLYLVKSGFCKKLLRQTNKVSVGLVHAANAADRRAEHPSLAAAKAAASALAAAPQYSYYLSSLSNCPNSQAYLMDEVCPFQTCLTVRTHKTVPWIRYNKVPLSILLSEQ